MIELSKEKTPIISDENYYYVFRALNNGDHEDIIKNGDLEIIRTDLKRYNEKHKVPSKYTYHDNVSLEEVWSHCKFCQTRDTNCISLATNPNVVLDYGTGYNNEYALVKIPKKDMGNYYFAGEYVLQEVEKN